MWCLLLMHLAPSDIGYKSNQYLIILMLLFSPTTTSTIHKVLLLRCLIHHCGPQNCWKLPQSSQYMDKIDLLSTLNSSKAYIASQMYSLFQISWTQFKNCDISDHLYAGRNYGNDLCMCEITLATGCTCVIGQKKDRNQTEKVNMLKF